MTTHTRPREARQVLPLPVLALLEPGNPEHLAEVRRPGVRFVVQTGGADAPDAETDPLIAHTHSIKPVGPSIIAIQLLHVSTDIKYSFLHDVALEGNLTNRMREKNQDRTLYLAGGPSTSPGEETGSVLLEWAIVVTGIFLGLLLAIDCGSALSEYRELSLAAFEAAATAGNYPGLEPGRTTDLNPSEEEKSACEEQRSSATFPCGQYMVQQRARFAARQNAAASRWSSLPATISVTSEYIAPGAGGTEDNTVRVGLRADYSGFLIRGLPVYASIQGPYLYAE